MKCLDDYEDAFQAYVAAYDKHYASAYSLLPLAWTASGRQLRVALRAVNRARAVVLYGRIKTTAEWRQA